jgi:hypothetical protein
MSSHSEDKNRAATHRQSPLAGRVAKVGEQKPTNAMSDFSADTSDTARGSDIDFSQVHRLEDAEPSLPSSPPKKPTFSKPVYDGKIHFRAEQDHIDRFKELLAQFGLKQGFAFRRMVELLEEDLKKE